MSEETREMLADHVESLADQLCKIDEWIGDPEDATDADLDAIGVERDTLEYGDVFEILNVLALEVSHMWRGASRESADWDSATVVFATGGPHIEAHTRTGDTWTVRGYWGGEQAEWYVGRVDWLTAATWLDGRA